MTYHPEDHYMRGKHPRKSNYRGMRMFIGGLVLATAIAVAGIAKAQELPTEPVWMKAGLMCDTEELAKLALDELNTPIPFPAGCSKIAPNVQMLTTIKTIGTYEAEGFIYDLAEYTVAGFQTWSVTGWHFRHYHDNGVMVFITKFGYWNKTPIEGYVPPLSAPVGWPI